MLYDVRTAILLFIAECCSQYSSRNRNEVRMYLLSVVDDDGSEDDDDG